MDRTWQILVPQFLAELAHRRRLSPLTVSAYQRELQILALAFPQGPVAVDTPGLRRELARAHAGGLSGRSVARRLAAWRTFFTWAVRCGVLAEQPARGLRAPRSPRRLPGVLGVEAASRLVQADAQSSADADADDQADAGDIETLLSRQDDAMFELLYSSGLRLAELVGLDLDRLDLAQGLVTVLGKGQRTRTVPVGGAACAALQRWLGARALLLPAATENAVFLGRRGQRVRPRTVQERLARRGRRLGLPARVHPHMLRHSCASHVLQSSADLRAVQELLGHASIASTQIYTHLDFQHLAQAYDAAHPRARRTGTQGEEDHEIPPARPLRPAGQ
ncbi:MAG: tyrosine recombinase XerC [Pseudomonadota bacterium]|nr:tyrosine recombinase XerC [Pseudomonadota bacterium]